ncbi:MAG: hypothetical protein IKX70_07365 [Treponema sp.]|nr:hypothetical protein [Treponema sp.]MBR5033469.1 hypothetical protein [Treponema sp.]
MTTSMGLGLGIGLLLALLIWFIFNKTKKTPKYDERQVAARGRAYQAGFFAFVAWELAEFFVELFTEKAVMLFSPGTLGIIEMLFCLFVYLAFAIFSDAYFGADQKFNKGWCIIMILLGATYIVQFALADNKTEKIGLLSVGIFIFLTMICIIIKQIINNKAEAKEIEE